ncbi:MAG: hypothetical protein IH627_01280 [Rubrivivax sp.]|nr:hypothetical protein [Rubrivivax sp.]
MANADELLKWVDYNDSTGKKLGITRQATADQVFLLSAKNGKVYTIRFENNFAKKHLYTSAKKIDKIEARARQLFNAPGSPKDKGRSFFMTMAQKQLTEEKFKKQIGHRSGYEQGMACTRCRHDWSKHFTKSGNPKESGKICDEPGCACTGWGGVTEAYKDKRTAQGKPEVNPLEGTPTTKNTVIWMNTIPKATFEAVVTDAIIAKENARAGKKPAEVWGQGHTGLDVDCEHIELDFKILASVVYIDGTDPRNWKPRQKATVSIKTLKSTDPNKPSYAIVHMHAA